jgi:hypothetical protein
MSFELSEFQPGMIKQTRNMRVHEPQICIVDHDHIAAITRFGTHIIVHGSKRSNFRTRTFKLKIQLLVFIENLAKQIILIALLVLKFDDSHGKTQRIDHHLHRS